MNRGAEIANAEMDRQAATAKQDAILRELRVQTALLETVIAILRANSRNSIGVHYPETAEQARKIAGR